MRSTERPRRVKRLIVGILAILQIPPLLAQEGRDDVYVSATVTKDAVSGQRTYHYEITSRVPIAAVEISKIPNVGIELVASSGWTRARSFAQAIQNEGPDGSRNIAFDAQATYLPGVGELRLYPAGPATSWDTSVPRLEKHVIAPILGSAATDPSLVASDVLEQVPYQLLDYFEPDARPASNVRTRLAEAIDWLQREVE